LEKLITAKEAANSGFIPFSYSQLIQMAHKGLVPAYAVRGQGKRINWWFNLKELYDYFTQHKVKVVLDGLHTLQKKPTSLGSGLSGRWA
jgi:hypothetical protein